MSDDKKQFSLPRATTHQSVCYATYDLGFHKTEYLDKAGNPKIAHKYAIAFELKERVESDDDYNGKRFSVYLWVNLNFYKDIDNQRSSDLVKYLESWRGESFKESEIIDKKVVGFDMGELINRSCMLGIVHSEPNKDGKVWANITSISPLMDELTALIPENKQETTPKWVEEKRSRAVPDPTKQPLKMV